MTRRRWAALRDEHLNTPEARALYEEANAELSADMAEYERLMNPPPNADPSEIQKRRQAFEDKHPEWFEDR